MASINSGLIRYEELRFFPFALFDVFYLGVGAPFANPVRMIKVSNTSDANLLISYDGITDQDFLAANSGFVLDFSSNKADQGGVLEQSAGTRFYVKLEGAPGTTGFVYVTIIYASNV